MLERAAPEGISEKKKKKNKTSFGKVMKKVWLLKLTETIQDVQTYLRNLQVLFACGKRVLLNDRAKKKKKKLYSCLQKVTQGISRVSPEKQAEAL